MLVLMVATAEHMPHLMLDSDAGETLVYETGETVTVNLNEGDTADVNEIEGGWCVCSKYLPDAPVDTVLVQVHSTPAMIAIIDVRLKAADARCGQYAVIEE